MSKKFDKRPLAALIGTAVAASFSVAAQADANPFAMTDLSTGYAVAAEGEMTCGEGKCGAQMKKQMQGEQKMGEGACAGKKMQKGKQGEQGEQGAKMKKGESAKGKESEESSTE